jgi:phosphoglycolate phosphatase-like HAD superfamily hydrolase
MMDYSSILKNKTAIIFEFDDVLFPQKDYDLQVYYLFANFIEYLESFPPSQEVISFIQKRYDQHQNHEMFEAISQTFGIDEKYKENLLLLFTHAKLPLKLLLFKEALDLLQELAINRRQIFILTAGDPHQQLNKIRQTEWNGLDKYLKIYFSDEFEKKPSIRAIQNILVENQLNREEVIIIGETEEDRVMAQNCGIDYKSLF